MALTLLLNRRPVHPPKNLAQIVVPLAMSYYFFLYPAINYLPPELRENLLTARWRLGAAIAAVSLSIVGYAISLWGLFYLRRSFALLVAVRKVVWRGPYAYVRHPMYLGYLIELLGLILSFFCPAMLILGFGFVMLTVMRARLEEERLIEACPEYGAYMERAGFLFPRFHSAPVAGA
jgi:protein-S-isoprenylcysteine O-methyltransferase Ste14